MPTLPTYLTLGTYVPGTLPITHCCYLPTYLPTTYRYLVAYSCLMLSIMKMIAPAVKVDSLANSETGTSGQACYLGTLGTLQVALAVYVLTRFENDNESETASSAACIKKNSTPCVYANPNPFATASDDHHPHRCPGHENTHRCAGACMRPEFQASEKQTSRKNQTPDPNDSMRDLCHSTIPYRHIDTQS